MTDLKTKNIRTPFENIKRRMDINEEIVQAALKGDVVELQKYKDQRLFKLEDEDLGDISKECEFVETFQFLLDNGIDLSKWNVAANAARDGRYNVMKWAVLKKISIYGGNIYGECAASKNIEMLEWLKEHNCPKELDKFSDNPIEEADGEALEWLKANGF